MSFVAVWQGRWKSLYVLVEVSRGGPRKMGGDGYVMSIYLVIRAWQRTMGRRVKQSDRWRR